MADDSSLDSSLLFIFMKTSENRGKSASRKFYADVDVSSFSLNNNQLQRDNVCKERRKMQNKCPDVTDESRVIGTADSRMVIREFMNT